jgi:iron complex transport system permease protein
MNRQQNRSKAYKRKIATRNTFVVLGFSMLLILSFLVSMNTGYARLSPLDTLLTLLGGGTNRERLILFGFRLPRIVISMLAGAGIALSGCVIQGITRNPLADPGLLGINAGAGLMVVLFVLFFGAQSFLSVLTLPFLALLGAGAAALIIYVLSYKRQSGAEPLTLILNGVAIQAGISALTTVLTVKLDETQFDFAASWQAGSIWGSNWKFVLALVPWLLALIPYVLVEARSLDILNLGDEIAGGLGISVEKVRRRLLFAAVALAASSVAVSGSISFVGLIAPHLARRLTGPRHRILLPACALAGAALVSVSDTIARVILQPAELPAGIIVASVGAPYFLYLLIRSER